MIGLHEAGINGILADEMGLGKTIELIGFLGYLREYKQIERPFLIIAPKSVLSNWIRELNKWCPSISVVKLKATKDEREQTLKEDILSNNFDVCVTTYQGINKTIGQLKKFNWQYIIVDEAHSIKNEMSLLSENVRKLKSKHIILLTGTPLQNNLHELWSLLNCLLPQFFSSSSEFGEWFNFDKKLDDVSEEKKAESNVKLAQKLRRILRPFLFRRTKQEVEKSIPPKKEIYINLGMTELQRKMYKELLLKSMLEDDDRYYHNTLMQLRKVCNHPYLFHNVEPVDAPLHGEHIVTASAKLMILDKLLEKVLKKKSKVILFSQMTKMLSILEDYLNYRRIGYCRIDGDTSYDERETQMDLFNDPNSFEVPVFLLSTRAGGLGISLTGADTVIIFDSDFNPQVDLQAMDRAHRIGQTKPVSVYRFITKHTIEEKIVERQAVRLKLESIIIKNTSKGVGKSDKGFNKDELKQMLQFGADQIFEGNDMIVSGSEDLDQLIVKGEEQAKDVYKMADEKIKKQYNLANFSINTLNLYEFENEDYRKKKRVEERKAINEALVQYLEEQTRRDRDKPIDTYNEEAAYRLLLGNPEPAKKVRPPKINPYHLYPNPTRLQELLLKERIAKQKQKKNPAKETESVVLKNQEERMKDNEEEEKMNDIVNEGKEEDTNKPFENSTNKIEEKQAEVEESKKKENEAMEIMEDKNDGLTEEERKEKDEIVAQGFPNWVKSEIDELLRCMKDYGITSYEQMKNRISTKTPEEIQKYAKALWTNLPSIPGGGHIQKAIERKQKERENMKRIETLIGKKITAYENPRKEMTFKYIKYERESQYTKVEDSALIYFTYKNKYGNWSGIRFDILHDPLFRFNFFIKTRNNDELKKRIDYLIKSIEKEQGEIVKDEGVNKEMMEQMEDDSEEDRIKLGGKRRREDISDEDDSSNHKKDIIEIDD